MPIYEITPIKPIDPSWSISGYKEPCRVHAPNEENARNILSGQFVDLRQYISAIDGTVTQSSPWADPLRAKCEVIEEGFPSDYREGLIFVWQERVDRVVGTSSSRGRWVTLNEDLLPSIIPENVSSPPSERDGETNVTVEADRFKNRVISNPDLAARQTQFVVEQAENHLKYLKDQRSNVPEAGEAIERLEVLIQMLRELQQGIEAGASADQSATRFQRCMNHILDDVEKFLSAHLLVKTTFAGIAVCACSAFHVSDVAQAVIAVSAVGADKKIIDGVVKLFKAWKGE